LRAYPGSPQWRSGRHGVPRHGNINKDLTRRKVMTSKVAIITDEIRKNLTAGDPTRTWAHDRPDFRLKRFDKATGCFGAASLCQSVVFGPGGGKE
jgi:hypothetical protein